MRTTTEIQGEIAAIQAKDKAYNRLVNEGGEGYERNSVPEALWSELLAAEAATFAAEWTAQVTAQRLSAWAAGVAALTAKHGKQIPHAAVRGLEISSGYTLADLRKAKALHGIK